MEVKMMKKYGNPVFGTIKDNNPVVTTTHGKVMGENRNGIAIFRGIPYGGDCDGEQRFLPPGSAPDWIGVRDCTVNGNYAIQFGKDIVSTDDFGPYFNGGQPELFGVDNQKQNENCLVLNVLTPGVDQKKRSVVVYIHGGGFATGSGTLVLGADRWVLEEDLVVVGVNHRLNVFGYLYLGSFDKRYAESGMAGMLDIVLALQWVQKNIAVFGGDPGNVTIMGESGGGMKVSTLMAMPKAKGLFAKAIVESGSSPVGRVSIEEGTGLTRKLLQSLGLKENEWSKLLTIPAFELLQGTAAIDNNQESVLLFSPVADNINLKYQSEDKFAAPDISMDIPLLVGSSEDELTAFLPVKEIDVSEDSLRDKLLEFSKIGKMGTKGCITEQNVDELICAFQEFDGKHLSPSDLFLNIISQVSFLGGGSYYQAISKVSQGGAPVYFYLIKYDAPHPVHPELRYSWHTADLPLQMRIVRYKDCEEASRKMAHCWAAFIRSGNPSTDEINWLPFTNEYKETMIIDNIWSMQIDPMKNIHKAQKSE